MPEAAPIYETKVVQFSLKNMTFSLAIEENVIYKLQFAVMNNRGYEVTDVNGRNYTFAPEVIRMLSIRPLNDDDRKRITDGGKVYF